MSLEEYIRDIPDFPIEGIIFKDITPLLQNKKAFREAIDTLAAPYEDADGRDSIDVVVAIESRGFIFGAPLAYRLDAGFVPIRKHGKLPSDSIHVEYSLEYGTNILEIHRDAIKHGDRVLIVDDLLATGGSARAAIQLVEQLGGVVVGVVFLVELLFLKGIEQLAGYEVFSVIKY
jgi:adenine phosphoribosyltransferase